MSAEYKLQITPVTDDAAQGQARDLLQNAREQLGFVPNMYRGMAIAPELLSTYMHGYDAFRQSGRFTAPEQEVVFLTISLANGCDYCTAAHSMLAVRMSGLPEADTMALRDGQPMQDDKLNALSRFTWHMWDTRGMPETASVAAFRQAGYDDTHILEIVLALAVKTISNYANHVNHSEVDDAFAAFRVERGGNAA